MSYEKKIEELIAIIDREKRLFIQTHNYPDHDAVAAAYGLHYILKQRGIISVPCYSGEIQSVSLNDVIERLKIPIEHFASYRMHEGDQIILVDGFMGNRNMETLPGEEIAVIDHHIPPEEPRCRFSDIRVGYGACSTIIYEYAKHAGVELNTYVATALLTGIMMDTAFLSRGVSENDLEAFTCLYKLGDWSIGSYMLKNSLSTSDIEVYREAFSSFRVMDDICFVFLKRQISSELMGILADDFLRMREIHVTIVCAESENGYKISVRSEDDNRPAGPVVKKALEGIGSGGGHMHMGGGSIETSGRSEPIRPVNEIIPRFLNALAIYLEKSENGGKDGGK